MKKVSSYRLSQKAVDVIQAVAKKQGITATEVVERAILAFKLKLHTGKKTV